MPSTPAQDFVVPTLSNIWTRGAIALIVGIILNTLVRSIAIQMFGVSPSFPPLSPGAVIFWTALLTLAATSVRAGFRKSPEGSRIFLWLAAGALLFSFTPDIMVLVFQLYPGTTLRAVMTLMSMHLVAGALCMTLLALPPRGRDLRQSQG